MLIISFISFLFWDKQMAWWKKIHRIEFSCTSELECSNHCCIGLHCWFGMYSFNSNNGLFVSYGFQQNIACINLVNVMRYWLPMSAVSILPSSTCVSKSISVMVVFEGIIWEVIICSDIMFCATDFSGFKGCCRCGKVCLLCLLLAGLVVGNIATTFSASTALILAGKIRVKGNPPPWRS